MINAAKVTSLLKERRKALGYSQEFMAYSLGISQSKFSRIESGSCDITLAQLNALLECLQMDLTELLSGLQETKELKLELERKEYALNRLFRELLSTREQNQELSELLSRFSRNLPRHLKWPGLDLSS